MNSRRSLHPHIDRLRFLVAAPMAYLLLPLHVLSQVPMTLAPNQGNARVYTASSGAVVVEINTPNAAGLSHNQFNTYNVPAAGAILNNAPPPSFTVPSQLAGTLTVNFNLKPGGAAGVILNEVVAPNASTISGFTEIAGAKADLIVANPYGIAVNGGGFINTDNVTLATGRPVLSNGMLSAVRVGSGELVVTGTGLNGANLNYLNLLGRSVKIDGPVNTKDLTVAAGANDFNLATREVTANASAASGTPPAYAIDSSIVGGMYAERIRLLATDTGVGVRALGDVAATTGDFTIDANGRVQLSGRAYAERDARITSAAGVEVSGATASLTAKRDIALEGGTNGALTLSDASLVAGRNLSLTGASLVDASAATPSGANRFAIGALTVNVTGNATISRSLYGAGGSLSLQAGAAALSNNAGVYSGADTNATSRSLVLRTTAGDLDLGTGQISSPSTLALTANRGAFRMATGGSIRSEGAAAITAATTLTNAGNITAGGALTLRGNTSITNAGLIQSAAALSLAPTATLTNSATGAIAGRTLDARATSATNNGTLQGVQSLALAVTGALTTGKDSAILTAGEAGRDITVSAGTLVHAGFIQSTGAANITVSGDVANSGTILSLGSDQNGANGAVTVAARTLANTGTVQSAGVLTVTTTTTSGTGISNSGTLQTPGALRLSTGPRLENATDGRVLSGGTLTLTSGTGGAFAVSNAGRIQATNDFALGAATAPVAFTQSASGITLSSGAVVLNTSSLDNAGLVQASGALTVVTGGALNNQSTGALLTTGAPGRDLTIAAEKITNAGQLQSTGALSLRGTGAIDNSGTLLTLASDAGGAGRAITVTADTLANRGTIQSAGTLDLTSLSTSTAVINTGAISSDSLTGAFATQFTNGATGAIVTTGDLTLKGVPNGGSFAVSNAGTLQSGRALTMGSSTQTAALTNQSTGKINAGTSFTLAGAAVSNAGTINAATLSTTSASFANAGSVAATGSASIRSASSFTNTGLTQAAGTLTVEAAQKFENAATGSVLGGNSVTIGSGAGAFELKNAGRIQSSDTMVLGVPAAPVALTNSSGAVLLAGSSLAISAGSFSNAGTTQARTGITLKATEGVANTGTIITAGQPGAALVVDAGSLANSGTLLSAGALTSSTSGALTNSGQLGTLSAANGGSDGVLSATAANINNSGTVASAGSLTATAASGGSISNTGTLQAAGSLNLTAPATLSNATGALILGGGAMTINAALSNAGTIQAGGPLTLGNTARAAFTNHATGVIRTSGSLDLSATSLTNAGTVASGGTATLRVNGSFSNRGSLGSSSSNLFLSTASAFNSGTLAAAGSMSLNAASSFLNTGNTSSGGRMALVTGHKLENTGAGTIAAAEVSINSNGANFELVNTARIQASAGLTAGTSAAAANVQNSGAIIAGGALTLAATDVRNAGTVQAGLGITADVANATTNTNGAQIMTTQFGAPTTLTGAALSNAGVIQSSGALNSTTSGMLTNSGQIATLSAGAGDLTATASTVTNSGTIASAAALELTARSTTTGSTSVNNSGTIQSATTLRVIAPVALVNARDAKILAGSNLTVQSGAGAFSVTNNGTVQAAGSTTIGTTAAPVALDNQSAGVINSGSNLNVNASTLANAGVIQAAGPAALAVTGALTNSATGTVITNGVGTGSPLTINASRISNAGTVQSSGALTVTSPGVLTNSGSVLTTGTGTLNVTAATLNNSGTVQAAAALQLTGTYPSGTALTNSGTISSTGNATLLTPGSFLNTATGTVDSSGTLAINNGSSAFTILNSGAVRSAQHMTLGTAAGRASLTNTSGAKILSSAALTAHTSTLANTGTVQASGTATLNATDTITNFVGGTISTLGTTPADLFVNSASLTNAGTLQSNGALTSVTTGATANSGATITTGTRALSLTGSTLLNTGTIQTAAAATLTATSSAPHTVTNTGTVQTAGALTIVAPGAIINSGLVSSASTLAINTGTVGDVDNRGTLQSTGSLTLGATGVRGALSNNGGAKLASAGTLTAYSTSVDNRGTLQAAGVLSLDATGAITNSGTGAMINNTSTAALTLNGASLHNAAKIQSAGALTGTFSGAALNSGTILGTGTDAVSLTSATFTNSGTTQSGGSLGLTAATLTNSGTLKSTGVLTTSTSTSLENQSSGKIASDAAITLGGFAAAGTGTAKNYGAIQAGGAIAIGANDARTALTNWGTILTDAALTAHGTTLTNSGTLQSGGMLTLDTTGAFRNNGGGLVASTNDLALTAGSAANSGTLQATGTITLGTALAALDLTNTTPGKILGDSITGYHGTLTNYGRIQADGALRLNFSGAATLKNNDATAKLLAGGNLTLDTTGASFAVRNAGLMQAGGIAQLGSVSHLANYTSDAGAKLIGDSLDFTAGSIDNSGSITGFGDVTIAATSLTNRGSASKLVFSKDSGTANVTVTGNVSNEGTVFGAANLALTTGGNVTVGSTGAIAALGNITLTTSGNATNSGALYSAAKLTLSTGGTFQNNEGATIDTDGAFASTSATFRNRGQVNIGGNGEITATAFENVYTAQPVSKTIVGPALPDGRKRPFDPPYPGTWSAHDNNAANRLTHVFIINIARKQFFYSSAQDYPFVDADIILYRTEQFVDSSGAKIATATLEAATKPQIAASNLTLKGFNRALNSGVITTPGTLAITGNTGSTFTNDALTLTQTKYQPNVMLANGYESTRPPNGSRANPNPYNYEFQTKTSYVWGYGLDDGDTNPQGTTTIFSNGAGIRAGTLVIQNVGTLSNLGSPFAPATTAKNASAETRDTASSRSGSVGKASVAAESGSGAVGLASALPLQAASAASVSVSRRPFASALSAAASAGIARGTEETLAGRASVSPGTSASARTISEPALTNGAALASPGSAIAAAKASILNGSGANALSLSPLRGSLTIGSLKLSLPTNPNGFFVAATDPQAKYRVVVNADLGIDPNAIGSDFLAKQIGLDPDRVQTRLGDPAYETYLVRQQLVEQLGTRYLAGQTSEKAQMESLMTAGAQSAAQLGLVWGQEPSPTQLARLPQDIVWMVSRVVDGVQVLVPQVYLSSKTRSMFDANNAQIAATNNAIMQVGDLNNTGGDISSGGTTVIVATGDITNKSGTISGANVGLKAGGSITNETVTSDQGTGQDTQVRTTIGRTGTISSTGDLVLDAGKDINVKGADINAQGNALINAAGDINVSTITNTSVTTTSSSSSGFLSSSSTSTTTREVTNIGSNINIGGNVKVSSGGDVTLAGSNLNVGGNLKTDIKGDLNVVDVQDTRSVSTTSSKSGFGVGDGIYGSQTTASRDITGTSKGSAIKVGGDADIKAGGDVTLVGSKLDVTGDGSIDATNINVLEGRNIHTNTTVTTTSTFGVFTDSGSNSGANSQGKSGGNTATGAAEASGGGSGDLTIGTRSKTEVSNTFESTSVASAINIGGDARLTAKDTITIRGSDVKVEGDAELKAKDILSLAAQDVKSTSYSSETVTSGFSLAGSGSGGAATQGTAAGQDARASGSVGGEAQATAGLKVERNVTDSGTTTSTARVTTITVGGDLTRTAENKIVDVGTQIEAGGDVTQSADKILSLAAQNTTSSTFSSDTQTMRLGVGAQGTAGAGVGGGTYGGAKGDKDASGAVGAQASLDISSEQSSAQSTTAVVSTIKAGGNINSTSKTETRLEGTQLATAKGDVNLSAETLVFEAARNTASRGSSQTNVSASAIIGLTGSSGGGVAPGGTGTVGVGVGNDSSQSSTAVVGGITSGGNIRITTTSDATFVGTNLASDGKTSINAGGDVNFQAARNTESSGALNVAADVSATVGGKNSLELNAEFAKENASKDTAVTSTLRAGSGLEITSGKSVTLEGTDLNVQGDTTLAAKGNVNLVQATSTEQSTSVDASVSASIESGGKGSKKDKDLGVGFGLTSESSKTADVVKIDTTGSLKIVSGGDTTLQGTEVKSGGATTIAAGGNLNLLAAEESSSSTAVGFDASVSNKEKEGKGGSDKKRENTGGLSAGLATGATTTQTGVKIESGGNVDLTSAKNITMVGTEVTSDRQVTVSAGGTIEKKDAVSTSTGGGFNTNVGQKDVKTDGTAERQEVRPENSANIAPGTSVGVTNESERQKTTVTGAGGVQQKSNDSDAAKKAKTLLDAELKKAQESAKKDSAKNPPPPKK